MLPVSRENHQVCPVKQLQSLVLRSKIFIFFKQVWYLTDITSHVTTKKTCCNYSFPLFMDHWLSFLVCFDFRSPEGFCSRGICGIVYCKKFQPLLTSCCPHSTQSSGVCRFHKTKFVISGVLGSVSGNCLVFGTSLQMCPHLKMMSKLVADWWNCWIAGEMAGYWRLNASHMVHHCLRLKNTEIHVTVFMSESHLQIMVITTVIRAIITM